MFLEDMDCAVYFCVSQIPWRLEVLHMEWVKHVHKGMFGNILCPHCRPSLAHQLTPRAAAFRLPLLALHGIPSPGPLVAGLQVDTPTCHCQSSSLAPLTPRPSWLTRLSLGSQDVPSSLDPSHSS